MQVRRIKISKKFLIVYSPTLSPKEVFSSKLNQKWQNDKKDK